MWYNEYNERRYIMINLEKQFTFKIKGIKFIPSIKNYGNDIYIK